jgi:hypothetical protein
VAACLVLQMIIAGEGDNNMQTETASEQRMVVESLITRGGCTVGAWGYSCPPKISEKPFDILYLYNTLLNIIFSLLSPYNSPNTLQSLFCRPIVQFQTAQPVLIYKQTATRVDV